MNRILVVEDEPDVRANIVELLTLEGYEVIPAENGQVGYFLALTEPFDLVICDILMPGLDGLEVIRRLRQHPNGQTIPVIFLTARTQRDAMREGMELGADDYISKPFTRKELLNSIQARLIKQKAQVSALQSRLAHFRDQLSLLVPLEMESSLLEVRDFATQIIQNTDTNNTSETIRIAKRIQSTATDVVEGLMKYLFLRDLEYRQSFKDTNWNPIVIHADQLISAILQEMIPDISIESQSDQALRVSEDDLSKLVEVISQTIRQFGENRETVKAKMKIDTTGEWLRIHLFFVPKPELEKLLLEQQEPMPLTNLDRDLIIIARIVLLMNGGFFVDMDQQSSIHLEIRLPAGH